jgi:hypothetical protein
VLKEDKELKVLKEHLKGHKELKVPKGRQVLKEHKELREVLGLKVLKEQQVLKEAEM